MGNDPINSIDPSGLSDEPIRISTRAPHYWKPFSGGSYNKLQGIEYITMTRTYAIAMRGAGAGGNQRDRQPAQGQKPPCPPLPEHPADTDIDANIRRAQQHRPAGPFTAYNDAKWFYNMVRNAKGRVDDVRAGRSWDYKQLGSRYEDFGNFNYGATGLAIGFSETRLLREAGRGQVAAKTSKPKWGYPGNILNPWGGKPPYGDDPNDQEMIKKGFEYYKAGCFESRR